MLMEQVAHQTIILQFILQLGLQMKTDPRNCYAAFFKRFETMQPEYLESFNDELSSFKKRVKGKDWTDIQLQIWCVFWYRLWLYWTWLCDADCDHI